MQRGLERISTHCGNAFINPIEIVLEPQGFKSKHEIRESECPQEKEKANVTLCTKDCSEQPTTSAQSSNEATTSGSKTTAWSRSPEKCVDLAVSALRSMGYTQDGSFLRKLARAAKGEVNPMIDYLNFYSDGV